MLIKIAQQHLQFPEQQNRLIFLDNTLEQHLQIIERCNMGISEKLMRIQTQIKAPKNLYNHFGKYHYRNAEGICEAVKPFLEKEKVTLVLTDDIKQIGERIYVQATAQLIDVETNEQVTVSAYARESLDKKGMDDSQITGTASSYARKYALNGLFLLDDTKDADTDEYKNQTEASQSNKRDPSLITGEQIAQIKLEMLRTGINEEYLCKHYNLAQFIDMTQEQYKNAMASFKKTPNKAGK